MAEVHIIGQIVGASDFTESDLFCVWHVQSGEHWTNISGEERGQTQVDRPGERNQLIWAHPVDIHYSTSTVVGWPKLVVQVWFQDEFSRNDFVGYGVINIPSQSGSYELQCLCWRPLGSTYEQISELLIGGRQQLKDKSIIWTGEDRRKLKTTSVGTVHVRLDVLLRNFEKFGVKM